MVSSPHRDVRAPSSRARAAHEPATRERILDVALACFAERGFDGSSTRAIASRAGVNQGLITYYFGSKQMLWREAVDAAFARLERGLAEATLAAGDVTDRERLALLIRRYVRFVAAHPEFVMLMNEEGKRESERMDWMVERHVRPVFEAMSRLYEDASRSGELPGRLAAPHFHYLFAGASATIFHQAAECRRLFGVDPSSPDVVERHADALVQLFMGDGTLGRDEAPGSAAPLVPGRAPQQ